MNQPAPKKKLTPEEEKEEYLKLMGRKFGRLLYKIKAAKEKVMDPTGGSMMSTTARAARESVQERVFTWLDSCEREVDELTETAPF